MNMASVFFSRWYLRHHGEYPAPLSGLLGGKRRGFWIFLWLISKRHMLSYTVIFLESKSTYFSLKYVIFLFNNWEKSPCILYQPVTLGQFGVNKNRADFIFPLFMISFLFIRVHQNAYGIIVMILFLFIRTLERIWHYCHDIVPFHSCTLERIWQHNGESGRENLHHGHDTPRGSHHSIEQVTGHGDLEQSTIG